MSATLIGPLGAAILALAIFHSLILGLRGHIDEPDAMIKDGEG